MITSGIGQLSSNSIYSLFSVLKGSPLETNGILLSHGSRDNADKFAGKSLEQVRVEDSQDAAIARKIQQSRSWEASVIRHEQAHMGAGGEFAGSASYVYSKGPDGKTYIVGGEVSMKVPAGGDLEKLKYALERVKQAASAPADPSAQDMKTAAMASAKQRAVEQEIIRKKALEAYEKSLQDKQQLKELETVEPFRKLNFREISSFEMAI